MCCTVHKVMARFTMVGHIASLIVLGATRRKRSWCHIIAPNAVAALLAVGGLAALGRRIILAEPGFPG